MQGLTFKSKGANFYILVIKWGLNSSLRCPDAHQTHLILEFARQVRVVLDLVFDILLLDLKGGHAVLAIA